MSKVSIVFKKKYRGVIFHEIEEGYKIWRLIDLLFQNWHKEFDKLWLERLKVSKIFILMGSFWAKYILFELKKYRRIIFHETEEGYKTCRGINLLFRNLHKKFDKFWSEHLEVSKIFALMGFFWAKYILFGLKKYRGVIFHKTEEWYKIWRRIDLPFKNWHKEFDKFWQKHSKSLKNFHFKGLLLSKVYIVWAKKVQTKNLSWNWRGIQNFGEEWTCHFKIGIRNLTNFDPSTRKVSSFILMGSFWAKYILFGLKKYRGVFFHETEEGYKIWRRIDLSFKNWYKEFDKVWTVRSKSL